MIETRGFCHCGCGRETPIAGRTRTDRGDVAGLPVRYLPGHGGVRRGAQNGGWRGGRYVDTHGYVQVLRPAHPRADRKGYVREHLLVAEQALGRAIAEEHPVHHVNEDRADNVGRNLVLCESQGYHNLIHQRSRALRECGHADWLRCTICHRHGPPADFPPGRPRHRECHTKAERARREP